MSTDIAKLPSNAMSPAQKTKDFAEAMKTQLVKRKDQLEVLLAEAQIPTDRFIQMVVSALVRDEKLHACTPTSIVIACLQAAEVGMSIGVMGHAFLVPYSKNVAPRNAPPKWEKRAQFIPGYKGMIHVAKQRAGVRIRSFPVYKGDVFKRILGFEQTISHEPAEGNETLDNFLGAYCTAILPGGEKEYLWMPKAKIDEVRDRAKDKNPVWDSDYLEMALKTPIRKYWKTMPIPVKAVTVSERLQLIEENPQQAALETAERYGLPYDPGTGEVLDAETPFDTPGPDEEKWVNQFPPKPFDPKPTGVIEGKVISHARNEMTARDSMEVLSPEPLPPVEDKPKTKAPKQQTLGGEETL